MHFESRRKLHLTPEQEEQTGAAGSASGLSKVRRFPLRIAELCPARAPLGANALPSRATSFIAGGLFPSVCVSTA